MKKNMYNMDTANAYCNVEPNVFLAMLLADELKADGFQVLKSSREAPPDSIVISGRLTQFFVEPTFATLEADIELTLTATTATGLRAERRFM